MKRLSNTSADQDSALRRAFLGVLDRDGYANHIGRDNDKVGSVSLGTAAERDLCVSVSVKDHFVVIDYDQEATGSYRSLLRFLRRRSIPVVITESGTKGHRHIFVRTRDEAERRAVRKHAAAKGLRVANAIRPPCFKHRSGTARSTLVSPTSPWLALLRLQGLEWPSLPLSPRILHLLVAGDITDRYSSRSEQIQAIVTEAVRMGVPAEDLLPHLLAANSPAGDRMRKEDRRGRAGRYLGRAYSAARGKLEEQALDIRGDRAVKIAEKLRGVAPAVLGSSRTAPQDLAIYGVHLDIVARAKRTRHGASVRQVAEEAGVTTNTVMRSRQRLVAAGLLRALEYQSDSRTSLWSVCIPETVPCDYTPKDNENVSSSLRSHDAFRHRGLGKSILHTWALLNEGARNLEELGRSSQRTRSTLRRHIARLEEVGAVTVCDGTITPQQVNWDFVADQLNVRGTGFAQQQRHLRERAGYERYIQDNTRSLAVIKGRRTARRSGPAALPGLQRSHH